MCSSYFNILILFGICTKIKLVLTLVFFFFYIFVQDLAMHPLQVIFLIKT